MAKKSEFLSIPDSPFARKLTAFVSLSQDDLSALADVYRRKRNFDVGHDIIYEGQTGQHAYILASGWACSYKILPDGTRQIVDFRIPGDFTDRCYPDPRTRSGHSQDTLKG